MTFDGNRADSGAAFAVFDGALLTFEKPDVVRFRNGELYDNPNGVRSRIEADDVGLTE